VATQSDVQSIHAYTAAQLTAANDVLQPYEMALETDTGFQKRGDGSTAYNSLGYIHDANPISFFTGGTNAWSNLEYTGLANPTDGALAGTGVGCFVPIPVQVGAVISKVSILVGATAAGTPTNQFAAIYSGIATPALIGQSTDTLTAAIAASGMASWTLTAPQTITAAMAPHGFIYAEVAITATTVPTAAVVSIPTAIGYKWFTNGPLFLSATAGSSLAGTAAATIASPSAKAVAPLVFLT
jgi:hypothetical protein